ncbi:unnamed protein product [Notodromas monacha]|uniref:RNA polymerase II-associated protein 3 n=1 Tax=Notodromas monacha TaxID=399045 RepID=A0A7R9BZV9_9CRUS|nr:unnamed protein product [Notodromas monacha]CAG0923629.1 unnamed protein product [Notodromas monacha]
MAEAAMRAQVSARRHAEEVEDLARDFKSWEKRMKERDAMLRSNQSPRVSSKTAPAVAEVVKEKNPVDAKKIADVQLKHNANNWKEKGNMLFKARKFQEAVEAYSKGIELDQHNALLPANRAMAYLKLEKFAEAEKDCDLALRLDPEYVKAYLRRGSARAARNLIKLAIQDFSKALELEPSNEQATEELAKLKKTCDADAQESTTISESLAERLDDVDVVKPANKSISTRSKVKRIPVTDSVSSDSRESTRQEDRKEKPAAREVHRVIRDEVKEQKLLGPLQLTRTEACPIGPPSMITKPVPAADDDWMLTRFGGMSNVREEMGRVGKAHRRVNRRIIRSYCTGNRQVIEITASSVRGRSNASRFPREITGPFRT